MRLFSLSFLCLVLSIIASTAEAGITIDSSQILAASREAPGNFVFEGFSGTTIPTSTTVNAISTNSHSNNTINWSDNGGLTVLSFDMDHKRIGTINSRAN